MSEDQLIDTALRIVVTPSQSSYFAGEPLSVTITITNTRSPQAQVVPPRSTHKRSAHSVSSARLARPPTSPGLPKHPLNTPLRQNPPKPPQPTRKGLIGTAPPENGRPSKSIAERRISAKSHSVDMSLHELPNSLRDDMKLLSLHATRHAGESSPRASSPLARTSSTPVPPNHPHARKASIVDGSVPVPIPQSASASSFALSLDPIAESMSPVPPTPPFPSPAPTPAPFISLHAAGNNGQPASRAYQARSDTHHHSQAHLGNGHPASSKLLPRDNTELVLYAYVHLTGSLFLLPPPSLARTQALAALQRHKRGPRGGGSMDIGVASPLPSRGHERRSASIAGSLWGLISSPASAVLSPGHRAHAPSHGGSPILPATRSFASAGTKMTNNGTEDAGVGLGLGGIGLGLGAVQDGEEWVPEQPMPVFEVPPAMLAVDLSLRPGEERSYTYTVKLPSDLPPTYRGRTLRFSYQLSVGACRATAGTPNSQSRVMKVPIRVYNHVSAGQPPRWYDLLTGSAGEKGGKLEEKIEEGLRNLPKSSRPSPPKPSRGSISDLRTYALLLLEPDPVALSAFPAVRVTMDDQELHGSEGGLTGCREAIEILTRVPKKVSYDVNKDGVKVAVLTFMKSAWRLGETVLGVVELNDRDGRARILKLSAMLEAHESLPSEIAAPPDARHAPYMRRVHAEHHASFMPQTLRTTFALDIPPDAAPAFRLSLGGGGGGSESSKGDGGLAWKVRLCLLVAVAAPGAQVRGLVREGPRGQWGSTWVPTDSLAPRERPPKPVEPPQSFPSSPAATSPPPPQTRSWASLLALTFLGMSDGGFHDGDEVPADEDADGEVDLGAGEEGWREMAAETVECEVPVMVWPGNTAFRPENVVFDV